MRGRIKIGCRILAQQQGLPVKCEAGSLQSELLTGMEARHMPDAGRDAKDPMQRHLLVLQNLPRYPKTITARQLQQRLAAQGFQVDLRTLQRDLRDSLSLYFPISANEDQKPFGWYLDADAQLNLPALDPASALALRLAEVHLQYLLPQTVMVLMRPHFQAASQYLDGLEHNHLANWARRVRCLPNGKALQPAEFDEQVWAAVSTALLEQHQLRVSYLSRSKGELKSFCINPSGLVARHSVNYLVGTVNQYRDLRQFALHRIRQAEVLAEPACIPADDGIHAYIETGAFATGAGSELVELISDIHPQIAWLLAETPLSDRQELSALPDSNWQRPRAWVPLDQEIFWWICGRNDHIRVHAPQVWVEEIRGKVERLYALYGSAAGTTGSDAAVCKSVAEACQIG